VSGALARAFRDTGSVTADDDEDALRWAGENDPSHVETPVPPRVAARQARLAGSAKIESDSTAEAVLPVVASSAFLISLGILGGVYLLYTVGWIISLQRFYYAATNALDQGAFEAQQYLAIAAPIVWFASVIWFTRHHAPVSRLVWLLVGAVLLVPWSFVMGS
jgi:hypothetical protein